MLKKMTCILKFVKFLQRKMKSTIHKMSHISKTTHAISMNLSLNVIHDIWTQKMQKGENIFFPHLDPFSQSWSNILI
jgi:hypothetical protein